MYVNCPVDIEVYDSSSNLVAAIYNDEVQTIENGLCTYIDENGQKIVLLPTDEEFDVKVKATDNGQMTYSIQETDADTGKKKITTYRNVAITKNDEFTGFVANNDYSLSKNSIELTSTVIENPDSFKVSVSQEGNGNISGGGYFYVGEFAKVTATELENEEFLGWYKGDELITSEKEYRFEVTEDIELTAKFTENTCVVLFYNGESLINAVRTIKGTSIVMPEEKEIIGYRFVGYYTDEELSIPFDESTIFSEDSVIYAKYISDSIPLTTSTTRTTKTYNKFYVSFENSIDNALIYTATYDEYGRLLGLQTSPCDGDDYYIVNVPVNADAKKAKIYVWEDNIKPIGGAEELTIE